MILFINACVRKESRTLKLTKCLLSKLNDEVEEVKLIDINFPKVDESFLNLRDSLISKGLLSDPLFDLANQFSKADTIVISSPFYDLSFPALLKQYFEQINVINITFKYSKEGIPLSLCKAKKLYYITTAGGFIPSIEYSYGYVKALANTFYGINNTQLIKAEGLDIEGADVDKILEEAQSKINI